MTKSTEQIRQHIPPMPVQANDLRAHASHWREIYEASPSSEAQAISLIFRALADLADAQDLIFQRLEKLEDKSASHSIAIADLWQEVGPCGPQDKSDAGLVNCVRCGNRHQGGC